MLDAALWWLQPTAREVCRQVVLARGAARQEGTILRAAGLGSRHRLAHLLQHEGLPSYTTLAGWIRLILWTMEFEEAGHSLVRSALREAKDPACRYRLVRRLTGASWHEVRARGAEWVMMRLVECCRPPTSAGSRRTSA